MSSDKAPEKVWFVKANFTNEFLASCLAYYVTSHNLSGETVLATYIREDLVERAKRDAAEYVLSKGTDNFIRRREMFDKVALGLITHKGYLDLSKWIVEAAHIADFLIQEADKFARGE